MDRPSRSALCPVQGYLATVRTSLPFRPVTRFPFGPSRDDTLADTLTLSDYRTD
jgi:hypothetical protein